MNPEQKDEHICLCNSYGLDIGIHDKNIHTVLGKDNNIK